MMKDIKALFIDIDNTLLDFDAYVKDAMKTGFSHFGLRPYEPWMYDVFVEENNKIWQALERQELTFEELILVRWNLVFEKLGIIFDGPTFETYFRKMLNISAIPVDGAFSLLEKVKGNYILCAASNGPYDQQIGRLKIAQMVSYFDHLFISEEIGASKPSKVFFERAFERMNADREKPIKPEECLMIGDSLSSDMAGGLKFGLKTCYYQREKKELQREDLDYVIYHLDDLTSLL